jgi:chromosomal replication initiation ATPase DnaA
MSGSAGDVVTLAAAVAARMSEAEAGALIGRRRGCPPVAAARQLAAYLAHTSLRLPRAALAAALGRDVSTIAHALRSVEDRRDDPAFDLAVTMVERALAELATMAEERLS